MNEILQDKLRQEFLSTGEYDKIMRLYSPLKDVDWYIARLAVNAKSKEQKHYLIARFISEQLS